MATPAAKRRDSRASFVSLVRLVIAGDDSPRAFGRPMGVDYSLACLDEAEALPEHVEGLQYYHDLNESQRRVAILDAFDRLGVTSKGKD